MCGLVVYGTRFGKFTIVNSNLFKYSLAKYYMKRGVGILFLFSLVAIFSIALISASFLDNFLGKITGNPISNSLKGDINQDGVIDKIDLDILVDVAFRGGSFPDGSCLECADINEDGVTDILDVSMMTNYVYRGGAFSTNSLTYICGDTNGDSVLDQTDLDAITSYAFGGVGIPANVNADLNSDGVVNILDVTIMTDHVKRNKPKPTCELSTIAKTYECGDANADGKINSSDVDKLSNYAFGGVEIPSGVKVDLNGDGVVD